MNATDLGSAFAFALAMLGSIHQAGGEITQSWGLAAFAAVLGGAGLIWWSLLVGRMIISRTNVSASDMVLHVLALIMIVSAAMIAFGRAGAGFTYALSSRYTTFSAVFWLAVLGTTWRMTAKAAASWCKLTVGLVAMSLLFSA